MCINPSFIWSALGSKFEKVPVSCKSCWSCKENRVSDYVGRALCEGAVSSDVCTLSLTYAPRDDLADRVITPRHFQLFIKLLRRAGHKVRYLVAGEYGELKGRAHFHALLFFTHIQPLADGVAPPAFNAPAPFCRQIPHKKMVHLREWPHGHVKADWSRSEASARYVCKYLLSDSVENYWFSLSKKPALGAEWFAQKAATARNFGVLPSSFEYSPPAGVDGKKYLMSGATRRDYLNAISTDEARRGSMSEWVGKTFDKLRRADYLESADADFRALSVDDQHAFLAAEFQASADARHFDEKEDILIRLSLSKTGSIYVKKT